MKNSNLFKPILLTLSLLLAALPLQAQMVSNNNDDEVNKVDPSVARNAYRPGEVIVKFKETSAVKMRSKAGKFQTSGLTKVDKVLNYLAVSEADQLMPLTGHKVRKNVMRAFNGTEVKDRDMSGLYRLRMDNKHITVDEAVTRLKELDEVEYAEPNYLAFIMADNSATYTAEPLYGQQWGPAAINLPQLWDMPLLEGAERPVIAILDTGVDITHPDLADNIWTNSLENDGVGNVDDDGNGFKDDIHGWDFINNTAKQADYNGHGTHCAGIAAAVGNNGIGITGANPDAYIMPITVMQSDGTGDIATIIKGIDYATANGASFLSMSIGHYSYSIAEEQALAKAYAKATLVAAAGNDGRCIYPFHHQPGPGPCYPAAFTYVLGVEAANENGRVGFSNWDCDGPIYSTHGEEQLYNYELRAPGVNIFSTYPQGRYKMMNGTSMACPLAAGAISRLMQSKNYEYQVINREILFGDLIHGANQQTGIIDIMTTYSITDADRQPTLWLVSTELNDEAEGDGDSHPDAGEIIDLYPTIRNDWGNATNIKLHLEMGDELEDASLIEFITNDVDFGKNLSGYGKSKSDNPIRFKVSESCADNRHIKLKLIATCDEISEPIVYDFVIIVVNAVKLGGMIDHDMVLYPNINYIVTSNLAIPKDVTLTIKPGTKINFNDNTGISNNGTLIAKGLPDSLIVLTKSTDANGYVILALGRDTIEYAIIKDLKLGGQYEVFNGQIFKNCILENIANAKTTSISANYFSGTFELCNYLNIYPNNGYLSTTSFEKSNLINSLGLGLDDYGLTVTRVKNSNCFNNTNRDNLPCNITAFSTWPRIINSDNPNYYGSSIESIVRESTWDIENNFGYAKLDLSNMLTKPVKEAHGIVWKVVVDEHDAQDEFDQLPPLGVGRHKFEVYFNRDDMDTTITPMLTMGVRPPYTQIGIAEDGFWSVKDSVSVYTAFLNITGKLQADGLNRIYVSGAQDGEHFEIPYENIRFNVLVQAAGSMATGFAAEPGLGKVNLTWNNENNNFDDAMGFNVYRFQLTEAGDTINKVRVNETIIDVEDTEYTDFNVTAGETYYYYYKVMSTDLKEYDISNVVAATPLTSIKGDANGSMSVNIADVVTIVSYLSQQDPQPFIFDAADVNEDGNINILDIVGVINIIAHPDASTTAMSNESVIYTISDGILYVDTPVALGGVQVTVDAPEGAEITTLEALNGMERTWIQLDENTRMLLSYSMTGKCIPAGKTALLDLNGHDLTDIVVSDTRGNELMIASGDIPTVIGNINVDQPAATGIYDMMGRKISSRAGDLNRLPHGIYIVNGVKVVK